MFHPYTRFRIRLARHALTEFARSLRSTAELLALLFAPVLLGLLVAVALPPLLAPTLPWPTAAALLLGHALAMALPLWLLRQRVAPADLLAWLRPLPLTRHLRLAANAALTSVLLAPLALAYLASITICLVQAPSWLRPSIGVAACVLSLCITWGACLAILVWREHPRSAPPQLTRKHTLHPYQPRPGPARARTLLLWHRLFWLPFWRAENPVGLQQSILLASAIAAVLAWTAPVALLPRGALAACASALTMLLTDRGDKAVREQLTRVSSVSAAWPVPGWQLALCARSFSMLPALSVLMLLCLVGIGPDLWHHTSGKLYLGLALTCHAAIIAAPRIDPRARVGMLALSILLQCAVGSEIWN